jgi:thioredoxin 1
MAGFDTPPGTSALTGATFDRDVLAAPGPVLVEFGATWCGPCRMIAPVLSAIAADRAGRLDVGVLDADEHPEIPARYGVLGLPTLILFAAGQPIMQVTGARSRAKLEAELDAALALVG